MKFQQKLFIYDIYIIKKKIHAIRLNQRIPRKYHI